MERWEVTTQEGGLSLVSFLKVKYGDIYSSRQLKRAIEGNLSIVNNVTERVASRPLKFGDRVGFFVEHVSLLPKRVNQVEKERILYEDDVFFAYDKPAGIASDGKGLINVLKKHNARLQLVHRLDRDTTGVLLLIKTHAIRHKMIDLFKRQEVKKTYFALADGIPPIPQGTIDTYLGKVGSYPGQTIWGSVSARKGQRAITNWECEKRGKNASLLKCYPKTGRTHQIRVHLSELGHPILGDFQYGNKFRCTYRPARSLLHARELSFIHPLTQETLCMTVPLPEDFEQALKEVL